MFGPYNDIKMILKSFLLEQGVRYEYLHTSGHARLNDLKDFVDKLSPKKIIPIHSFHPEQYHDFFENVQMVDDGEEIEVINWNSEQAGELDAEPLAQVTLNVMQWY